MIARQLTVRQWMAETERTWTTHTDTVVVWVRWTRKHAKGQRNRIDSRLLGACHQVPDEASHTDTRHIYTLHNLHLATLPSAPCKLGTAWVTLCVVLPLAVNVTQGSYLVHELCSYRTCEQAGCHR